MLRSCAESACGARADENGQVVCRQARPDDGARRENAWAGFRARRATSARPSTGYVGPVGPKNVPALIRRCARAGVASVVVSTPAIHGLVQRVVLDRSARGQRRRRPAHPDGRPIIASNREKRGSPRRGSKAGSVPRKINQWSPPRYDRSSQSNALSSSPNPVWMSANQLGGM